MPASNSDAQSRLGARVLTAGIIHGVCPLDKTVLKNRGQRRESTGRE